MNGERIFTKRLILRRIEQRDLALVSEWSLSTQAHGDYLTPENHTLEECLNRWQNDFYWNLQSRSLLIEQKEAELPLGRIRYWNKQNDRSTARMAVNIAVPAARGKGYGTEAQLGLIHFLFTSQPYSSIEMFTDIDNLSEQRCLSKLCFSFIETHVYEDQKVQRQGHLYRLTRNDFDTKLRRYIASL